MKTSIRPEMKMLLFLVVLISASQASPGAKCVCKKDDDVLSGRQCGSEINRLQGTPPVRKRREVAMPTEYDGEECHLDVIYECPNPPDATSPAKYAENCIALIDNHYSCSDKDGHGYCQFQSSQG
ncbi:uncharacterized protein LOC110856043 [Folsomia candida]|uniref:uncharacterized protein LOC110856043 n=1 Tax=Folsomia candida TaxID=158441 RepID=UPI000B901C79|nr:uncharacterized protein LOC110856043 [Folsomia candida]